MRPGSRLLGGQDRRRGIPDEHTKDLFAGTTLNEGDAEAERLPILHPGVRVPLLDVVAVHVKSLAKPDAKTKPAGSGLVDPCIRERALSTSSARLSYHALVLRRPVSAVCAPPEGPPAIRRSPNGCRVPQNALSEPRSQRPRTRHNMPEMNGGAASEEKAPPSVTSPAVDPDRVTGCADQAGSALSARVPRRCSGSPIGRPFYPGGT